MIQLFDAFDKAEMPYVVLCNPNREELYTISGVIYKTLLTKRFNSLSEFTFVIPSTTDNGETLVESYESILAKRLILIENEGYFIIDSVDEDTSGQFHVKTVKCKSQEAEMLNKRFVAFNGTYKFYNLIADPNVITLCDKLLELLPTWSMGYVDLAVAVRYRTFDISDSTVYGFLMNDCEKKYGCIFDFDTVAKTINVYDTSMAVTATDIYLSYENLIKNSTMTELTDEVVTALYVTGSGILNVASVNPLGTSVLYDFTYYKPWMSTGLQSAVTAWENLIVATQPAYAVLLTTYRTKNYELIILQGQYDTLNGNYTAKETEQAAALKIGTDISVINGELLAIKASMDAKQIEITAKQAEVNATTASILAINNSLSFATNFTQSEFEELSLSIYENTYQNDGLVVTDLTTPVEYQDTAQELYNQALDVLSRSSLPRYEFKMDTANFVAMKEYTAFTAELELGCSVTVKVKDTYTITPVLLEISLSYDDPTQFSLVFSNRLRLDNGNFQYADLVGQVVTTGSAVSGNSQQWSNWDSNYKDTVSTFITSSLDASKNTIINSSNQEILINTNGLRARTLDPNTGLYDPNQVWLTSNLMAFTDDNWNTAKLALGKITWNGNTLFGLVGDAIVGKILAGNQLQITNSGSNFTLDQNGARLNNASFIIQNGQNAIVMTPNEEVVNGITTKGISIQTNNNGTWENVFYTDTQGNLILKSGITAAFGEIGGWKINTNGLSDTHGNYINSDGNVKLGGLSISPGVARFTGDVYASRFFGKVVGASNIMNRAIFPEHIDHLDANLITAGEMLANRIYGGIIRGPNGIAISLTGTGFPYITGNLGFGIFPGVNEIPNQTQGLEVRPEYNSLAGYTHIMGGIEFHDVIHVSGGGTGTDLNLTYQDQAGTQTLKFRSGILVSGPSGPWGLGGTGSGEVTPPTGGGIGGLKSCWVIIGGELYYTSNFDTGSPSWSKVNLSTLGAGAQRIRVNNYGRYYVGNTSQIWSAVGGDAAVRVPGITATIYSFDCNPTETDTLAAIVGTPGVHADFKLGGALDGLVRKTGAFYRTLGYVSAGLSYSMGKYIATYIHSGPDLSGISRFTDQAVEEMRTDIFGPQFPTHICGAYGSDYQWYIQNGNIIKTGGTVQLTGGLVPANLTQPMAGDNTGLKVMAQQISTRLPYRSQDGGLTWQLVSSFPKPNANNSAIVAIDASRFVWASGSYSSSHDSGVFYTSDFGATPDGWINKTGDLATVAGSTDFQPTAIAVY